MEEFKNTEDVLVINAFNFNSRKLMIHNFRFISLMLQHTSQITELQPQIINNKWLTKGTTQGHARSWVHITINSVYTLLLGSKISSVTRNLLSLMIFQPVVSWKALVKFRTNKKLIGHFLKSYLKFKSYLVFRR